MNIENLLPGHWEQVKSVYECGIATGNATFQTSVPGWEEWNQSHTENCRLVAVEDGRVLGWAALTPVSGRCVYAGVGKVSVYVHEDARRKGIGDLLLKALIEESGTANFWTLQAGIFPENTSSLHIHEKNGFRRVGFRKKIGKMNNVWRDTIILERRSTKTGV